MTRTPPRGWRQRQNMMTGLEKYQMVCGHYQKVGVYACVDCNLAPLNDLLHLREVLVEMIELAERLPRPLKREAQALDKAKAVLAEVDG